MSRFCRESRARRTDSCLLELFCKSISSFLFLTDLASHGLIERRLRQITGFVQRRNQFGYSFAVKLSRHNHLLAPQEIQQLQRNCLVHFCTMTPSSIRSPFVWAFFKRKRIFGTKRNGPFGLRQSQCGRWISSLWLRHT